MTKFMVGQHVLVQPNKNSNDGISRKLEPHYKGPFVVSKLFDNNRYIVDELPGLKRCKAAYTKASVLQIRLNHLLREFLKVSLVRLKTNNIICLLTLNLKK